MRRRICAVTSLLLIIFLFCGGIPAAQAAGGRVAFRGAEEKFSFAPGSGYTVTDLFPGFKDVMPGDVLTQTLAVRNQSRQRGVVKLYLRAVPHGSGNSLSYSGSFEDSDGKDQSGIPHQRDETVNSMSDFLSQLTLRVFHGTKLVSENALSDSGSMMDGVYLGTLERYEGLDLILELEVPAELDNRYARRVGETDWIFTAEVFENAKEPDVPKTGDMILAAIVIMSISGLLFLLILLTGRRSK